MNLQHHFDEVSIGGARVTITNYRIHTENIEKDTQINKNGNM